MSSSAIPSASVESRCLVYCRLRPETQVERETAAEEGRLMDLGPKSVNVRGDKNYQFDGTFGGESTQAELFESIGRPVVEHCLNGYRSALMAYGQTGTGKSFTMCCTKPGLEGIIPRAAQLLFDTIEKQSNDRVFSVQLQFLQIYRDNLGDLMTESGKDRVDIFFDKGGVTLPGCSIHDVKNTDEFMEVYNVGNARRVTTATAMNPESSRGHSALLVWVTSTPKDDASAAERRGKITFIDLAGYERFSKTGISNTNAIMKDEAKTINASLLSLGHVVSSLSNGDKHIPWRNSKLTRLLQDSIGGRSRTTIILTIGPSGEHLFETTNTLQFGQRAMAVKVQAKTTETVDYARLAAKLQTLLDEKEERINALELQAASFDVAKEDLLSRHERDLIQMRGEHQREVEALRSEGASDERILKVVGQQEVERENLLEQQKEELEYNNQQNETTTKEIVENLAMNYETEMGELRLRIEELEAVLAKKDKIIARLASTTKGLPQEGKNNTEEGEQQDKNSVVDDDSGSSRTLTPNRSRAGSADPSGDDEDSPMARRSQSRKGRTNPSSPTSAFNLNDFSAISSHHNANNNASGQDDHFDTLYGLAPPSESERLKSAQLQAEVNRLSTLCNQRAEDLVDLKGYVTKLKDELDIMYATSENNTPPTETLKQLLESGIPKVSHVEMVDVKVVESKERGWGEQLTQKEDEIEALRQEISMLRAGTGSNTPAIGMSPRGGSAGGGGADIVPMPLTARGARSSICGSSSSHSIPAKHRGLTVHQSSAIVEQQRLQIEMLREELENANAEIALLFEAAEAAGIVEITEEGEKALVPDKVLDELAEAKQHIITLEEELEETKQKMLDGKRDRFVDDSESGERGGGVTNDAIGGVESDEKHDAVVASEINDALIKDLEEQLNIAKNEIEALRSEINSLSAKAADDVAAAVEEAKKNTLINHEEQQTLLRGQIESLKTELLSKTKELDERKENIVELQETRRRELEEKNQNIFKLTLEVEAAKTTATEDVAKAAESAKKAEAERYAQRLASFNAEFEISRKKLEEDLENTRMKLAELLESTARDEEAKASKAEESVRADEANAKAEEQRRIELESTISELREKSQEYEKQIKNLEEKSIELEAEVTTKRSEIDSIRAEQSVRESQQREELEAKMGESERTIHDLRTELDRVKSLSDSVVQSEERLSANIRRLESDIHESEALQSTLSAEISILRGEKRDLETKVSDLESEKSDLFSKLEDTELKLSTISAVMANSLSSAEKQRAAEKEEMMAKLSEAENARAALIDEHAKESETLRSTIENLMVQLESAQELSSSPSSSSKPASADVKIGEDTTLLQQQRELFKQLFAGDRNVMFVRSEEDLRAHVSELNEQLASISAKLNEARVVIEILKGHLQKYNISVPDLSSVSSSAWNESQIKRITENSDLSLIAAFKESELKLLHNRLELREKALYDMATQTAQLTQYIIDLRMLLERHCPDVSVPQLDHRVRCYGAKSSPTSATETSSSSPLNFSFASYKQRKEAEKEEDATDVIRTQLEGLLTLMKAMRKQNALLQTTVMERNMMLKHYAWMLIANKGGQEQGGGLPSDFNPDNIVGTIAADLRLAFAERDEELATRDQQLLQRSTEVIVLEESVTELHSQLTAAGLVPCRPASRFAMSTLRTREEMQDELSDRNEAKSKIIAQRLEAIAEMDKIEKDIAKIAQTLEVAKSQKSEVGGSGIRGEKSNSKLSQITEDLNIELLRLRSRSEQVRSSFEVIEAKIKSHEREIDMLHHLISQSSRIVVEMQAQRDLDADLSVVEKFKARFLRK